MSFVKLENGKVRFIWPDSKADKVFLVGDFNEWNESSHPLRLTKSRRFELEMNISPGQHHFKYLIDGVWWNDPEADTYADNYWGSEDSVIMVESNHTRGQSIQNESFFEKNI
jgi:1,4-alpha-glucan branching enzyme